MTEARHASADHSGPGASANHSGPGPSAGHSASGPSAENGAAAAPGGAAGSGTSTHVRDSANIRAGAARRTAAAAEGPALDARTSALTARIVRRETHSPRTAASIVAAVLGLLFCLYVLLEAMLQALGQDEWLLDPPAIGQWLADLPSADPLVVGLVGVIAVILGLWFLLQGLLPGHRARYALPNPRAAVVVDAEVLAASLARRARITAGVSQEQVLVTVGRGTVEVSIRPTSGIPVDAGAIRQAVEDELLLTNLEPQPQVTVQVATIGAIGQ